MVDDVQTRPGYPHCTQARPLLAEVEHDHAAPSPWHVWTKESAKIEVPELWRVEPPWPVHGKA